MGKVKSKKQPAKPAKLAKLPFPLASLPPEMQGMIASYLDAPALAAFRLVSKNLYTTTKTTPKMTEAEWLTLNRKFETGVRRKADGRLLSLVCSKCKHLLEANLFTDCQAKKAFWMGRKCARCFIEHGGHNMGGFTIGGVDCFGCAGCLKPKGLDEGDWTYDVERGGHIWMQGYYFCKECSPVMKNLFRVRSAKRYPGVRG